ncbi:hypothetical protein GCM10020260_00140 [Nesterenkonia halobia]|uniref:C2H2-type domain-containing protein n=1 Tax=Nesterenkonia halobia TaxID=37922 RepID=A0ABP6R5J6_9MICC
MDRDRPITQHRRRSLSDYNAQDAALRAAWGPSVEVPAPAMDEAGYSRWKPWRAFRCLRCRLLIEERHLVVHADFHDRLDAWLAE